MTRHVPMACLLLLLCTAPLSAGEDGYWSVAQADAVAARTLDLHLDPALDALTPGEKLAVGYLLQVGDIMHRLYLDQVHPEALSALEALRTHAARAEHAEQGRRLLALFDQFKGPIATTTDNTREPFVPVAPEQPTRHFYPPGTTSEALEAWMNAHPDDRAGLLAPRTIVRRADGAQPAADLATLTRMSWLEALHPGLRDTVQRAADAADGRFYAVPYALVWADDLLRASGLLHRAADAVAGDDADFADYLRLRARDLLSGDYEAGDAAWVSGRFGNLNAQIGAYETYEDHLYGVKAAYSLSLVVRDTPPTEALRRALGGIRELEQSLPYDQHRTVRDDLPVGVYRVVADFGQARGTNTATILPNEARLARKYGRTILLRHNILANPELHAVTKALWTRAVLPEHADDLTLDAGFYRTLWHEIGHYLGPDGDRHGRTLSTAMGPYSDLMEELKADLVSLYSIPFLEKRGYYTADQARAVRAAGIYRTLQKAQPRATQPYQRMQLMQFNFFLASPVLTYKPGHEGRLAVDYAAYDDTVALMLKKVLALQYEGDQQAVAQFVNGLSMWTTWLHADLAKALDGASPYLFRHVHYGALKGD